MQADFGPNWLALSEREGHSAFRNLLGDLTIMAKPFQVQNISGRLGPCYHVLPCPLGAYGQSQPWAHWAT